MKKSYLLFPLSLLIIVSQSYIFSGKTFFINDGVDNPYVVYGSFDFIEEATTQTSFEFSIEVVDNSTNDFYNQLVQDKYIYVSLKESESPTAISEKAITWSNRYSQPSDGVYYFEYSYAHPNITYTILSLDYTGLAVGDSSNPIDNKITIIDDLGVSDNTVTTLAGENPYIINNGFAITSTTIDSVEFQITVINNIENSFIPENNLSVILRDSLGNSHQTTASYVGAVGNTYTYKITELEAGTPLEESTTYQIYSLNNTGLAVGNDLGAIDDEIIITDDLGVVDNSFTTSSNNPYIEDGGFAITSTTIDSVEFEITVTNDTASSFIPENDLNVTLKDDADASHQTTASYVGAVGNTYTYEITELEPGVPLTENTTYQIYSLNNTGLAVGNDLGAIDDEIIITDDLGVVDNSFTTSSNNPYIEDGGFAITSTTIDSVEFEITVTNDTASSFIPENDLNVTLKDDAGASHQTTASYVGAVGNTYTYEITELEPGVPLTENTTYQIYSLNNTGLAVGNDLGAIDDEIIITDDLGVVDNSFTTSSNNPYIEDGGFAITSTTIDSVEFEITVTNDTASSFIPENDLNVTLKDDADASHQTTASYVGAVGNTYTYEINELEAGTPLEENTTYQIYSLNNTGLAVGNDLGAIDDEIIITDDLGVVDNSFTTSSNNPYIEDGGFAITSTTIDSVEFEITVTNDTASSFIPENDLNVTLKDDADASHQTTASYVGAVGNTYTYKITELEAGTPLEENTTYQIYSLNNTGLAVGNDLGAIDDEILIDDELHADGNFLINGNPYIEENDFEISNISTNSVEFQITVTNDTDSSFIPENDLNVTLKDSLGYSYNTVAHYKEAQGNTYTYEINELEAGVPLSSNSSYEIYSLNNTGLAINDGSSEIDDEILLQDDLDVYDNVFKTLPLEGEINESLSNSFIITIVFLVLILIAIALSLKILFSKRKKH